MKTYKLTDDCLEKLSCIFNAYQLGKWRELEQSKEYWVDQGFPQCNIKEVVERVELCWHDNDRRFIDNSEGRPFTEEERLLCEQALNGELYSVGDVCEKLRCIMEQNCVSIGYITKLLKA